LNTKDTFYKDTYALWRHNKNCKDVGLGKPDFTSEHQSKYYYTKKGVYRLSSHWGKVGSCFWKVKGDKDIATTYNPRLLFCSWDNFTEINLCESKETFSELIKDKATRFIVFGADYKANLIFTHNTKVKGSHITLTEEESDTFFFRCKDHPNYSGKDSIYYFKIIEEDDL
jgi:hypothetical protein